MDHLQQNCLLRGLEAEYRRIHRAAVTETGAICVVVGGAARVGGYRASRPQRAEHGRLTNLSAAVMQPTALVVVT
jgi:hypothetical protein